MMTKNKCLRKNQDHKGCPFWSPNTGCTGSTFERTICEDSTYEVSEYETPNGLVCNCQHYREFGKTERSTILICRNRNCNDRVEVFNNGDEIHYNSITGEETFQPKLFRVRPYSFDWKKEYRS